MWRFPVALATTLRCNNTRAYQRGPRGIERANTTRRATRWAKGVQKWRKPAINSPKPTVACSVSACFAVRHNGAGEHDGLVIAVALVDYGDRKGGLVKQLTHQVK